MIDITDYGAILQNQFLTKTLTWNSQGFYSDSLVNRKTGQEYCRRKNTEFSFTINGTPIASYSESHVREVDGNLEPNLDAPQFSSARVNQLDPQTQELELTFALEKHGLIIRCFYRIADNIPGIVKQLQFEATQDQRYLTKLVFDTFNFYPGNYGDCDHFQDTDDQPIPLLFAREGDTDLICCHNRMLNEGFMVGNTAPGVLRRIFGYVHWNNRDISYAMGNVPFAKYLNQGELFTADQSLLLLYAGPREKAYGQFKDLVRMILPPQPPQGVMYCTWIPFLKNISEELILKLAQRAADMGCHTFVLDDGWFISQHHQVDTAKFPHGLAFLSQKIRDMGLDFGLWYNIGTSYGDPDTPKEFACKLPDGTNKTSGATDVLCFGSDYRRKVIAELKTLAETYHVSYFKLDFSCISSPYAILPWGCHSHEHKHHHGYEDSFIEMYIGFQQLRNELKRDFPNLLVDFSFEVFGLEPPTIAALKYSDLNHVSNYNGENEAFQNITNIRKLFYRWMTYLPTERILGGLLVLQNQNAPEYLLTSFTGAPLVSGDLNRLDDDTRNVLTQFTNAFNQIAKTETLTELKVLRNDDLVDAFLRTGKSGHGFLAAFNRQDTDVTLNLPTPFPATNVLDGETIQRIPAHACAMFRF